MKFADLILIYCIFGLFLVSTMFSEDIDLELALPATLFSPCIPCGVDLLINNPGSAVSDAQLFVVFSVGTDDFWFYPGWTKYPPELDWEVVDIDGESEAIKVRKKQFRWETPRIRSELYPVMNPIFEISTHLVTCQAIHIHPPQPLPTSSL